VARQMTEMEPDISGDRGGATAGLRYEYETPWPVYAAAWSFSAKFRIAVGSANDPSRHPGDTHQIQIIELNEETQKFEKKAQVDHPFPVTKIMWWPEHREQSASKADLFASSSTTLDIWKYQDGQAKSVTKLANTRTAGQTGAHPTSQLPPLTSFDWSSLNRSKLGASSVDTTCTIWNLDKQKIETQLIAHDKAVHDIAFGAQNDALFASVGADGSVRLFDQRNLDHSTIIYECQPTTPLLRLAWNKININHIATLAMDMHGVILIDMRRPSVALASLSFNEACVNSITWAPHSRHHLLCGTTSDDGQTGQSLIWDVKDVPVFKPETSNTASAAKDGPPLTPMVTHDCDSPVLQTLWPGIQPDWVCLGHSKKLEVMQI